MARGQRTTESATTTGLATSPASARPDAGIGAAALQRVAELLGSALGVPIGLLAANLLSGGRSNLTYEISDELRRWVLRRPPLGHVLDTAHDMRREFRVIRALRRTSVPAPDAIVFCDDETVLGAPFYVMSLVEGQVFRSADDLAQLSPDEATALGHAFIDTLADLHAVDYVGAGLANLGRAEGYLDRQLRRWNRQLASSRSRDVAGFTELSDALGATIPRNGGATLVHGDFRLDNAIVDPTDRSTILAVLDWEMATLGDPLSDLGLCYLYWEGWGGLRNPIAATPAELPGFPSWSDLAKRYAARTGTGLADFAWYQGFALFKFAAICEGIHYRHVNGLTVGPDFDRIGVMVPDLVQRGLTILGR
jgi:aminoglycoside phosphotransferase (APT) family kinase protein